MTDSEIQFFEKVMSLFKPMTNEEQETLLKMLIFEYLECSSKIKGRGKKYWQVQATTYEFLIHLFTESVINPREFVFSQVEKDYKLYFDKVGKA